jgi:hypothetical protein
MLTEQKENFMGALGIVTCEVLELEFAYLLAKDTDVGKITVLETGCSKGFIKSYQKIKGTRPVCIDDIGQYILANIGRLEVIVHVLDLELHTVIEKLKMSVVEKDVIRKHSLESSKVIKDAVIAVVRELMGNAPLEDDLTIIVVKLDKTDG